MRILIQRVTEGRVESEGRVTGVIGAGLVVFLAIAKTDTHKDADYLADGLLGLRIFSDDVGKMNRSVQVVGGSLLIVSNFTLYGNCRKGRRPGFDLAAEPDHAQALYNYFVERAKAGEAPVATGIFRASMAVHLINDGPVTLLCDSVAGR
jgi:D-tyrosyl-tRNA(Tyr) deacylase